MSNLLTSNFGDGDVFVTLLWGGGREMSEQKMQIIGYCQTISLSLLKMAGHTMYFLGKGRKVW